MDKKFLIFTETFNWLERKDFKSSSTNPVATLSTPTSLSLDLANFYIMFESFSI